MASNRRDTQPEDGLDEWSDDDDAQELLALVMDTQPQPEIGLSDAAHDSAYGGSDEAELRRRVEQEVRTVLPQSAIAVVCEPCCDAALQAV